jgi:gluconolactonase
MTDSPCRLAVLMFVMATTIAAGACGAKDDAAPGAGAPGAGGGRGARAPEVAPDTVTPAIAGVVSAGTVVKFIQADFNGTEGPISLPGGDLIFTETRANRINRIDANDSVSSWMENTNGSNALAFDADGKLYSVQTNPGSMKIGIIHPAGSEMVLVDSIDGRSFARPNDLVRGNNGSIYFTDFSILNPSPPNVPAPAVYHIAPGAKRAVRVADGIARPNGIMLSQDEKVLFVNDMWGEHLLAFDVQPNGTLTNRRNFAAYAGVTRDTAGTIISGADGLALDADGRLYAATAVGVQVFTPDGKLAGTIPVGRVPQNIAFAGADKRTLYIVGSGAAFKVQLQVAGFGGRAK